MQDKRATPESVDGFATEKSAAELLDSLAELSAEPSAQLSAIFSLLSEPGVPHTHTAAGEHGVINLSKAKHSQSWDNYPSRRSDGNQVKSSALVM